MPNTIHRRWPALDEVVDHDERGVPPEARHFGALKEVAGGDSVDEGVAIVADGHGELHPLALNLPAIEARLRRHDVVERRHAEAAAGLQREMASVSEDYKELEVSYGDDMLVLVVASGFIEAC